MTSRLRTAENWAIRGSTSPPTGWTVADAIRRRGHCRLPFGADAGDQVGGGFVGLAIHLAYTFIRESQNNS